jgi:hypothetical protein
MLAVFEKLKKKNKKQKQQSSSVVGGMGSFDSKEAPTQDPRVIAVQDINDKARKANKQQDVTLVEDPSSVTITLVCLDTLYSPPCGVTWRLLIGQEVILCGPLHLFLSLNRGQNALFDIITGQYHQYFKCAPQKRLNPPQPFWLGFFWLCFLSSSKRHCVDALDAFP